jgi:hypothetical protein
MEKLVRVFNVERPEAAPQMLPEAPAGIRSVNFLADDTLLTTCVETPNLT